MDDSTTNKPGDTQSAPPPPVPSFGGGPPPPPPAIPNSGAAPVAPPTQPSTPEPEIPGTQMPVPPPEPQVTQPKKEKSKVPVFFIILIVIILVVWGAVFYIFFTNQNTEKESFVPSEQISVSSPTPIPTPTFNPDDIEIVNGSVYKTTGEINTLLVNKEDYPGTGIAGFASVTVSPDYSQMCFEALPPALEPALYYSTIDGSEIKEVGASYKNCIWSNDSSLLAFVNDAAADSAVDIYKYDLAEGVETNLTTISTTSAVFRRYEIDGWFNDDSTILCNYQEIDPADPSTEVIGNCSIEVATSKVTDL